MKSSALQTVTIAGQPCAIVPLAEYHALREALEDAADDARLLRLRAENAGSEAMPAAFFDRMLDGESPVRCLPVGHRNQPQAGFGASAATACQGVAGQHG